MGVGDSLCAAGRRSPRTHSATPLNQGRCRLSTGLLVPGCRGRCAAPLRVRLDQTRPARVSRRADAPTATAQWAKHRNGRHFEGGTDDEGLESFMASNKAEVVVGLRPWRTFFLPPSCRASVRMNQPWCGLLLGQAIFSAPP